MSGDIIDEAHLEDLPGIQSTLEERQYASRRASTAVESAWRTQLWPAPQWVIDIAIDVAARYLTNPRGTTSSTRSVDDASRTERFYEGQTRPLAPFELSDRELDRLDPMRATTRTRRVGSVRLRVPGFRP